MLTIHMVQVSVYEKEPEKNLEKVVSQLEKLDKHGLAVLPELFISGYDEDNIKFWAEKKDYVLDKLTHAVRGKNIALITGSISVKEGGKTYNRSYFISSDGEIKGYYDKTHLFALLHEDVYFTAGSEFPVFDFGEFRVGINICYDLRFCEAQRQLYLNGTDLIILPAAWPYARTDVFTKLSYARAIENQCYFLFLNRASHSPNKLTYGGKSMLIAPDGELVAECGVLDDYKSAEIDIKNVINYRKEITCLQDRRSDLY